VASTGKEATDFTHKYNKAFKYQHKKINREGVTNTRNSKAPCIS